jgi:hypothetical protein
MKLTIATFLIGIFAPTFGLAGQAVVIQSSSDSFAVGASIDDGQTIELGAGTSVTFINAQGATVTRTGPFSGRAVEAGDRGGNDSVVKKIAGFLSKQKQEVRVGAVRALGSRWPEDPWVVPVDVSGRVCTRPTDLRLWRPDTSAAQTSTIRLLGRAGKAEVTFAPTEAFVAWPTNIILRDGGTYLIGSKGGTRSSRLVLSIVPEEGMSDGGMIAWMIDQGCADQARRAIQQLGPR